VTAKNKNDFFGIPSQYNTPNIIHKRNVYNMFDFNTNERIDTRLEGTAAAATAVHDSEFHRG